MIYKQCVLTIANNTATLDEDIYLYRLDKNVELYFTIVNNKYKFDKSDLNNIIMKTNASYFQMRLYKNAEVKYTFAIQPTEDGKAILTITDDLIDEPIEVGDYDFQISLLDEDKSSMISMPIVSKQLHVCEPLVDAVSESTIDTAAIDTASVMDTDEGELPVVDSTGKYIPTIWNTKDIISKAKMTHIEQGILQAHTDALSAKIPQITPPKGQTTSDIVTVYNELPEKGLVYFTDSYYISDAFIIGLCYIDPYTDNNKPAKTIICTSTAIYVNITSTGDITGTGVTNNDLDKFITDVLKNPTRQKGQVLTMLDADKYGWADTIPHITPPDGQDTSDIINIYNELPDNGLVFFTKAYGFADAFIVGLCSVGAYTTENGNPAKTIICTSNAMSVDITSTGVILDYGISNFDLDNLMKILNNKRRTKGQVLTMTSNSEYGWADTTTIPKVTPPEGHNVSDLVKLYNALPDSGLVYINGLYVISDNIAISSLCDVQHVTTAEGITYKNVSCGAFALYVNITSTGEIHSSGLGNPQLDKLTNTIDAPSRQKGQVLTMLDANKYGWADAPNTTPELCIHNITGNAEVELTLDPYQLINITDATPQDLSPKYTVDILTPNIEESDNHVYKIHVIFMTDSKTVYIMPSGMYDHPPTKLTDGMIYEFIFTYVKPKWIVHCIEYSTKHSNAPV